MADNADIQSQSREHILLYLPSSPTREAVVEIAVRMARAYQGSLTALIVEPSASKKKPEGYRELQKRNMELIDRSGAQIITTDCEKSAQQLTDYAKANNITKIVVGYSMSKKRPGFCWRNNIDKMTYLVAPDIEVYVIN